MSQNSPLLQKPATTRWTLDPSHSHAEFVVRHLMVSNVRGSIPVKSATIIRDERDITQSRVEAELDVAAISSGFTARDGHLRSADFFDVENHPTMKFASTRVESAGDGLRVHGDLTIRSVTQPVILDVEVLGEINDPWGGTRAGITATTTFDRRDFGLVWNAAMEAGGVLVGDKVKVKLDFEAVKEKVK